MTVFEEKLSATYIFFCQPLFIFSAEWEIAPESYAQNLVKSSAQSEMDRVERVLKEKRRKEAAKEEL